MTELINNSIKTDRDCVWCGAKKDVDAHSPACPNGERYWQIQAMGGVPYKGQAKHG